VDEPRAKAAERMMREAGGGEKRRRARAARKRCCEAIEPASEVWARVLERMREASDG